MLNRSSLDESSPVTVESHMSKLIDVWGALLTTTEFKIAECLYRVIEQNGGRDVRISGPLLAKGAGVGGRSVDAARKTLAAKGIFRVETSSRGTSFGLPRASASLKTSGPECPVAEIATERAPAPAAAQYCGPTPIAGLDIQAPAAAPPKVPAGSTPREAAQDHGIAAAASGSTSTTAAAPATAGSGTEPILRAAVPQDHHFAATAPTISVGTVGPAAPASHVLPEAAPGTAAVAAVISVLKKPQNRLLQALQNSAAAPEPSATTPQDRRSIAIAQATPAGTPVPTLPGRATAGPAARASSIPAIPARGDAKTEKLIELNATPKPLAQPISQIAEAAKSGAGAAPAHPLTAPPANIEDKAKAAARLLTGLLAGADFIKLLLDSVPDRQLLLDCLEEMLARGERYFTGPDLFGAAKHLYGLRFDERAQQAARARAK
jgi:hypothetical protein